MLKIEKRRQIIKKFVKVTIIALLAITITFNLIPSARAATATVDLGTAISFAILAGTPDITNVPTSVITGNVGLSPATGAGIGLTQAQVTGTMYAVDAAGPAGTENNPALVNQAKLDLTAAYLDAAGRTPVTIVPTELGGTTKFAGVYGSDSTAFGITAGAGPLILDGQDDPNAVFIFEGSDEEAGALTVGPGGTVSLINGASACNVFWRVYGATIDTSAVFKGNILALTSITVAGGVGTESNIEGRLLARNASVTLDHTTVSVPTCTAASTSTSTSTSTTTTTTLPGTGKATSGSSILWYILMPVAIIAISTLLVTTLKKKSI